MAKINWTDEQERAISAHGGTVLVSAAAGSGKTAVLVERVIRRITDSESGSSIDRFLIVTFTNAAAAQMKTKISQAITKKIIENPHSEHLRRQQILLSLAKISTIDSFCINLVRDNFHAVGVSPDFKLLDESRLKILKNDAVSTVLESLYAENSKGFHDLCDLVCDSRDDSALIEAIYKIYEMSRAYPFPEKWLSSLAENYRNPCELSKSAWGKEIYSYLSGMLSFCIDCVNKAIEVISHDETMCPKYTPALESDLEAYTRLEGVLAGGVKWDDARAAFFAMLEKGGFAGLGRAPRGYTSDEKEYCAALRGQAKDAYISAVKEVFCATQKEHEEDASRLLPCMECLADAVNRFAAEFDRLKKAENGADFSDTLHLAIKLLAHEDENGNFVKTELAEELSEDFDEILVDEYQDVNEAQDLLFRMLSKDESNLFMVGDVKQSIYGFRQAMPDIFLDKRENFSAYDGVNYPATVVLSKNFRSRKGVTENVNFIFSRLMTKALGGLEYGDADALRYDENQYISHSQADTCVHLVKCGEEGRQEREIKYIADYIEQNVGRLLVKDGASQRPATYGDFCVLMRSVKYMAQPLLKELESRGIPVICEAGASFFEAPEIRVMLALLRTLDNPVDDISLLTVMMSPFFGFDADAMARIRTLQRRGSIYHAVVFAAQSGDSRCAGFLEELERLRRIALTVSVSELVRRLYDETGYYVIAAAMKDAATRKANLKKLVAYAASYESTGKMGLSGFLRYIDKAEKSGVKATGAAYPEQSGSCVKIMTIHKSKGLEFPVCILADCSRKFNTEAQKDNLIISKNCAAGIRCSDPEGFVRYDTVARVAAKLESLATERAEELRVLYVALTRAKERLEIIIGTEGNEKFLSRAGLSVCDKVNAFSILCAANYSEVIASALVRHPDAVLLRQMCRAGSVDVLPAGERLEVVVSEPQEACEQTEQERDVQELCFETEKAMIEERLSFEYPYAGLDGVLAKRVASDFSHSSHSFEFFASSKPAFIGKNEMTPAQRGTATHKFMQFADFEKAKEDVEKEITRLFETGELSESEAKAVERDKLERFFTSDISERIFASDKVYREIGFTCAIPAGDIHPGLYGDSAKETVVVDGVADCAFVEEGALVIVDYKTDRNVTDAILAERYTPQVEVYRRCLEQVLKIPVKEAVIYSFFLSKTVRIE